MEKQLKLFCVLLTAVLVVVGKVNATAAESRFNFINSNAPSSKGNDFVLAFFQSASTSESTVRLFVTTDEHDPVPFTVTVPFLNMERMETAIAGETIQITLQSGQIGRSGDIRVGDEMQRNKGIHVKAEGNKTISVFGLNSDSLSADAFTTLPCVSYNKYAPDNYRYYVFSTDSEDTTEQYNSQFLIVPCEDNTTVDISASQILEVTFDISINGFPFQIFPDTTSPISVNHLQTALFESPHDLTGTLLRSNKPITVIVGHKCGQVPVGVDTCGVLVEQVPPDITYGQLFLTVPQPSRQTGERYRIGSISRRTNRVNVTCTTEGTTDSRLVEQCELKERQFCEFDTNEITTEDLHRRDFCSIESEFPVTVMQYTKSYSSVGMSARGHPAMVYIPPVAQYLNDFTVRTDQRQTSTNGYISYAVSSQFFSNTTADRGKFLINGSNLSPDGGRYTPIYCSDSSVCGYGAYSSLPKGDHTVQYNQTNSGFFLFVTDHDEEDDVSSEYPAGLELEAIGLPMIEISNITVAESVGMVQVPIKRIAGDTGLLSEIIVRARDQTALGNEVDYDFPTQTGHTFDGHRIRFRRNEDSPRTEDVLNITIIDDDIGEPTETFEIFLVDVIRNAYVTEPIGTVTIIDDDPYISTLSSDIQEGEVINITCVPASTERRIETTSSIVWLKKDNNSISVVKLSNRVNDSLIHEEVAVHGTSLFRVARNLLISNARETDSGVYICHNDENGTDMSIRISVNVTNECLPVNECKNGGECIDVFKGYECDCVRTNYTGPNCDVLPPATTISPKVTDIVIPTEDNVRFLQPINLTCEATGSPPPTYHWYRDGQIIEGKINSHLYIEEFSPSDRGYYHCEAININNSDVSEERLLALENIRQYLIEVNNVQSEVRDGNVEELRSKINMVLTALHTFDNSVKLYGFMEQDSYSNGTTIIISVLLTLKVGNTVSDESIDNIQDYIKSSLTPAASNVTTRVTFVRFDGCPKQSNEPHAPRFPNITESFEETEIGKKVRYRCPCQADPSLEDNNYGNRMCGGNYTYGAKWGPVKLREDCGLTNITLKLCQIELESVNDSKALAKALADLNSTEIEAVDIKFATRLLEGLTQDAINGENAEVRENYLKAIDNLIQADSTEIAKSQTSTRLLTLVNNFSDLLEMSNSSEQMFVQSSYAVRITNIKPNEFNGETLTLTLGSTDELLNQESELTPNAIEIFSITGSQDRGAARGKDVTAVAIIPKNIFKELGLDNDEVQRLSYSVFTHGNLFQSSDENQTNLTLVSIVVSVRVKEDDDTHRLVTPIEVQFQTRQLVENATDNSTRCGYWDISGLGSWLMDSCDIAMDTTADSSQQPSNVLSKRSETQDEMSISDNNSNVAVVHYSQPGHFGLLLDLTHGVTDPLPEGFTFALQVITYIGLAASLICLVLFLITYLGAKQLRTNEHGQILINISIALICLYVIFLGAAFASPVPVVCGILAALLQYFMLVYLAWTAAEAFYLYMKLVQVLGEHIQKYVLKAALITWLAPILIVVLSAGPGYEFYYVHDMSAGFCRAVKLPFWLGTILPFGALYVFNWVMFILIVVSLCRRPALDNYDESSKKDQVKFIKQQVTIAFGLATLFGLGWGFGLAASGTTVDGLTLAFQIIFSIFVGFQGVLLFVLHGIKKKEARKQWKRWFFVITRRPWPGSTDSKSTHAYDMSASFAYSRKTSLQKDSDYYHNMSRQSSLLKGKYPQQNDNGFQLEKQPSSTTLEIEKLEPVPDTEAENNLERIDETSDKETKSQPVMDSSTDGGELNA